MHNLDNLKLFKVSQHEDYDSFFEEDDIQDFELDRELNLLRSKTDHDEIDDYFWDEN
ncbi:MAG: hypothetical protein V2I56_19545 [Desulfobacteraceae bacterium]|jgi:hypothetical protein|nr:hypothetical protein [Desulfobacteraceae bacterium]